MKRIIRESTDTAWKAAKKHYTDSWIWQTIYDEMVETI